VFEGYDNVIGDYPVINSSGRYNGSLISHFDDTAPISGNLFSPRFVGYSLCCRACIGCNDSSAVSEVPVQTNSLTYSVLSVNHGNVVVLDETGNSPETAQLPRLLENSTGILG
jgi:hypothetical protein